MRDRRFSNGNAHFEILESSFFVDRLIQGGHDPSPSPPENTSQPSAILCETEFVPSNDMELTRKFIVELDLVGFSRICAWLEQQVGARATQDLNDQISDFIRTSVAATGRSWNDVVYLTTGDGAILGFDVAEHVYLFGKAVNDATREHNKNREKPAKRYFRIGAAYGEIAVEKSGSEWKFSGMTVARAVRLEAAVSSGCMLIDQATFDEMPARIAALFSQQIRVRGKGDEIFTAHLTRFLSIDEAGEVGSLDKREAELPTKLPKIHHWCDQDPQTVRRNNLEIMSQLHSGKLIDLVYLLQIPEHEQPSLNDTPHDRARSICDWATQHSKDRDLCMELTASKEPLSPSEQPTHSYPSPFSYGPSIERVTPRAFYTRLINSAETAHHSLSLIYLPPDRLPYPEFEMYLRRVNELIDSSTLTIKRMVAITDLRKMRLVINDLCKFRDKQCFSVALIHHSCTVTYGRRKYPLPPNVQIIDDDLVYLVDPVYGYHQEDGDQSASLIVRSKDYAELMKSYYVAWWRKCAELKDVNGLKPAPLYRLLDRLQTKANREECDELRGLLGGM